MQAFILAAGIGSRLKPFTDFHPKPLAVVQGKTLLQRCLEHVKKHGYTKIIMNLHTMPEQIIDFLKVNDNFGLEITWIIEEVLLETGGGIKNATHLIDMEKPLSILNADILSNIDLSAFNQAFHQKEADALLAVKNRNSSRKLIFNKEEKLVAWKNENDKIYRPADYQEEENDKIRAFSGIQIINPQLIKATQLQGKFSLIDFYLELCNNHAIYMYEHNEDYLLDVGTPEKLEHAQNFPL